MPAAPAMPSRLAGQHANPAGASGGAGSVPGTQTEPPRQPDSRKPSRLGLRALATAEQQIGVREEPKGSNSGPDVDRFTGGRAEPWCAHFVSWCVEQQGKSPFGHRAAVASLRDWGKRNGKYVPAGQAEPQPGDIFTMARHDKAGKLVGGHTGFVARYDRTGNAVETVEGNTSDRVQRGRRSLDQLDGFIRL